MLAPAQGKYTEGELGLPFSQINIKNPKLYGITGQLSPWPTCLGVHTQGDAVETLGRQPLCRRRGREELWFHCQPAAPLAPQGLRLTRVGSGSQMKQQL